jgi:hypothetical protein
MMIPTDYRGTGPNEDILCITPEPLRGFLVTCWANDWWGAPVARCAAYADADALCALILEQLERGRDPEEVCREVATV